MGLWRENWSCRNGSGLKERTGIRNCSIVTKSLLVHISGIKVSVCFPVTVWAPTDINQITSLTRGSTTRGVDAVVKLEQVLSTKVRSSYFLHLLDSNGRGISKGLRKWEWSWLEGHSYPQNRVFWGFCENGRIHKVRQWVNIVYFMVLILQCFTFCSHLVYLNFTVVVFNHCLYHPKLMNFYFPIS